MNSISNISILPEINSTSIWHTLVDNVLNGIAYLFAAILSTRARKIETAPVGVLQNTSAIETVLDIYGNAKYSLQGTTQGRYLTGGVPPVRFSM